MGGTGGMFFGGVFMWVIWLLVIIAIIVAVRAVLSGRTGREEDADESPLAILEKRYARGEIDREEYQRKKEEIGA